MIGADKIAICAGKQVQQGLQVLQGGGHDDHRHLRSLPADSRQLRACYVSWPGFFVHTRLRACPCRCLHVFVCVQAHVNSHRAAAFVRAQGCIHWCSAGRLLNGACHDTVGQRIISFMGYVASHAAVITSPHHL